MTIAKDFASKFAVAFVAAAMILTAIAPAVQAAEADDLQTTINDLLAQVADLQAQLGDDTTTTTTTTTTTSSCDVPMAPLTVGSMGGGVTGLQERLIADGHAIAAGATGYFGAQTKAALASWQAANNVAPAVGYYGPITAAAMKASCTPADEDDSEDDSDDSEDADLQGEGTLSSIEIDDADETDIEEGAEDAEIAEITLEAEDGDVEVTRIDLNFGAGTTEDPWDVFETISLWVDGEMIGEFDASDEDEYLDEDNGEFRISGLNLVVMEDEEVDVVVGATVVGSVDTLEDWTLTVDGARAFDADGVADDVTSGITGTASFDIVAEGDGDDLELSRSTDSPDEGTLVLDESDSVEEMIFAFELDADDSDRDISVNDITVDVAISSTTGEIDDVVEDFYLMIEGERFDAETYTGNNDTASVDFDIDGDVEIGAGELATVEVYAEFAEMETDSEYQGITIVASVDQTDVDAEGADDIVVGGADQDGEEQTLRSTGLYAAEGPTTETDSEDGVGTFEFTFELTAIEEDMYVNKTAATSFDWTVTGGAGTTTATLQSDAEEVGAYYEIAAGQSEEFTLVVTHDPAAAGSFYVTLDDVTYRIDSTSGADQTYTLSPSSEWDTSAVSISAS